jgi:hypothetical protein
MKRRSFLQLMGLASFSPTLLPEVVRADLNQTDNKIISCNICTYFDPREQFLEIGSLVPYENLQAPRIEITLTYQGGKQEEYGGYDKIWHTNVSPKTVERYKIAAGHKDVGPSEPLQSGRAYSYNGFAYKQGNQLLMFYQQAENDWTCCKIKLGKPRE